MTTTAQKQDWTGSSGQKYTYEVYPIGTNFRPVPGNYIFARYAPGEWFPIYIGETSDLSQRFDNHHAMPCIKRNGATHIHVHENNSGVAARRAEESDLIRRWNPPCNG